MSDNGLRLVRRSGSGHVLVIHVGCAEIVCVANFEHFFCMHGFFFFPGPPNLGLSKQNLHEPQSLARHPLYSPHLLRLLPKISYYSYICMYGCLVSTYQSLLHLGQGLVDGVQLIACLHH